jgi:2,3,4,5-tetrahydropyridine-2-carboxylate N-succinyltransferase
MVLYWFRCIVVEEYVGKKAVLGANVCLTASTKIIDVGETRLK